MKNGQLSSRRHLFIGQQGIEGRDAATQRETILQDGLKGPRALELVHQHEGSVIARVVSRT